MIQRTEFKLHDFVIHTISKRYGFIVKDPDSALADYTAACLLGKTEKI